VRDNLGGSVDELEGVEFMVIDTSNFRACTWVRVRRCRNATIGASIHEGTSLLRRCLLTWYVCRCVATMRWVVLGVGTVATEGKTLMVCSSAL
jgi:hypothetical protein